MKIPTKDLELWLLGWSESHSGGCKVTFQVTEEDLAYFRNATVRKGKTAGQRYAAVLVQLNDDETPDADSVKESTPPKAASPRPVAVPAAPVAELAGQAKAHELAEAAAEGAKVAHKPHFPGGFCGLAVQWCDDVRFRDWLTQEFESLWLDSASMVKLTNKTADIDRASIVVKRICGVDSRSKLDTDDRAHLAFANMIRQPYMAYLKEIEA